MNQYRCETCKFISRPYDYAECRNWNKCSVLNGEIDVNRLILIDAVGCVSHSNFKSEREVKELFRKEIGKWKEEDPLFMSYVYGQEAGRKDERDKVLDNLITWIRETKEMARCNLDHRWGTTGNRHVELILSQVLDKCEELRQQAGKA